MQSVLWKQQRAHAGLESPCGTGEQRLIKWTVTELLLMTLQQQHVHLLSHGRLFDLGLMAKALYNYKEIQNPTGLKCASLQLDC